jgi:LPS-assembly protein
MRFFFLPQALGIIALGIAASLPRAAQAQEISIDTAPNGALHDAMLEAAASAHRQDWTREIKSRFCNGCYVEPPNLSEEANLDPDHAPMRISAEDMDTIDDNTILLQDEVEVYQGWRRMRADRLRWFEAQERVELEGDVQFREPGLLLMSDSAWVDNINGTSEFENPRYLMHERGLRGGAAKMRGQQAHSQILLDDASYTSCPPGDTTWQLQAGHIELDRESGFGKARHALLEVEEIPVFYWPYIEFPIDDRRHSGFLWPSIGGSDNGGIDLAIPYYFNLAPNYDATYTPRYLNTHGLIHEAEVRYLNQYSEWVVGGTYLGNSEQVGDFRTEDYPELDRERWLLMVQEQGMLNRHWKSLIDYQRVSDIEYFRDLGVTGLDVQRALFIREAAQLSYNQQNWHFSALLEDQQKLVPDEYLPDDYQRLPRLSLSYNEGWANREFQPQFTGQYTFFHSNDEDVAPITRGGGRPAPYAARGHRLYVEPGLSYPVRGLPGFLIPTVKIKHVNFDLSDSNDYASMQGSRDITVPTFSLDGGLFFERDTEIGGTAYLHTLEPRLFYYYADYVEQDSAELPNFDTAKLFFSYSQLFRDRRFSSYDRIDDADQLTISAATRWIDQDVGREMLSIGVGQILYFRDRQVTLSRPPTINDSDDPATREAKKYAIEEIDKELYRSASDVASELQWHPTEELTLLSSHIWDPYRNSTVEYLLATQWHSEDYQTLLSGSYRFRRIQPLAAQRQIDDGDRYFELIDTDVEQVTLAAVYPLARRWTLFANWTYEMTNRHTVQDLIGAEYESCCYRLRLFYQRERDSFDALAPKEAGDPLEYGYTWMLQVELKGLGGVTGSLNSLLEQNFPGYMKREEYRYKPKDKNEG